LRRVVRGLAHRPLRADIDLMRRTGTTVLLSVLLAIGPGVIWLVWADHQYAGQTGCPWDLPNTGHPVLVGLALVFGSMLIAAGAQWKRTPRVAAAAGLVTGTVAGLVVLVVAFFFGAGLQCTG
jgi:hypothetical protein